MRGRRGELAREKFHQPFWKLSGEQRKEIREQLVKEGFQKRAIEPFRTKHRAAEEEAQQLFGRPAKELGSTQKQQLQQHLKNVGVLRPENSADVEEIETKLSTAPITSQNNLGGGVNKTYKVRLASGDWAVFKTREKADWAGTPETEVAAWRVGKLAGLQDLMAPCVLRRHNGETGCLMKWWDGTLASKAGDPWDGAEDLARAAAFDYVIGNPDRHDKNWMISKEGKLQLIDNGYSFKDVGIAAKGLGFLMHAQVLEEEAEKDLPIPKALAKPYVENREKILVELKGLGVSQGAMARVNSRILALEQAEKWADLPIR